MAYKHSPYAMKKLTFMMLLAAFFTLCITSCSKDDDDSFAYPMEQLYGKWKAVEIKVDGKWYDVTKYPYTRFGMDITFKPLRLRLMVNGMMSPNTLIHGLEWTSPSMRMANSMALAT